MTSIGVSAGTIIGFGAIASFMADMTDFDLVAPPLAELSVAESLVDAVWSADFEQPVSARARVMAQSERLEKR